MDLHRQLATDRPSIFNANLASSLHSLSINLSNLGHQEEPLKVIQEVVNLHRQLAADWPTFFNAHLTSSLYSLSVCLSSFSDQEEALEVI